METDRRFLPRTQLRNTAGAILHEVEGKDDRLDRRDGKFPRFRFGPSFRLASVVSRGRLSQAVAIRSETQSDLKQEHPQDVRTVTLTAIGVLQVQKLRNAMLEYDNDRWRIISAKVGSGFSPAACKEKASELEAEAEVAAEEAEENEEAEGSYGAQTDVAGSSSDRASRYQ